MSAAAVAAKPFAKLFETPLGQILVKLDTADDDGRPEVRFYFDPAHEALRVCSFAISFPDSDAGEEAAGMVFAGVDQAGAEEAVQLKLAEIVAIIDGVA